MVGKGTSMLTALLLACFPAFTATAADEVTNSIGIKMVKIPAGSFEMGGTGENAYWNEKPVHTVVVSRPFYISVTEVTAEQYKKFRSDYEPVEDNGPYATAVSWHDAAAFCEWLSAKEGKTYRFPTEAEWEYAARAGASTAYFSGDRPPEAASANAWGLVNIHSGPPEWVHDWYGDYPAGVAVDPIGPKRGMARVVRGGALDGAGRSEHDIAYYARCSNRAGIAPSFGPYGNPGSNTRFGRHHIGFRVVRGEMPATKPSAATAFFARRFVRQATSDFSAAGPDPAKPYYRKRYMLPTPLENSSREAIDAAGLHPSFRGHNHSPALEVCPNGDVLLVVYTSEHEYEPEVSLIAARLRYGCDQWDMPSRMFDFPGVNDHATMLWREGDNLYLFWGNPKLDNAFPFQWMTSRDNGATWSEVRFPDFHGEVGGHSRQPINSALRDPQGNLYVSSDGSGGRSVLWKSPDNGRTWVDPGGRSGGRHTTFALLSDGSILGLGGKKTDIDGYMPQSHSTDEGRSWQVSKTVFCAQSNNQRPTLIRLSNGRLFFAADFQRKSDGFQPDGIKQRGSYAALSDDDGASWHIKKLPGAQVHENEGAAKKMRGGTLGYAAAREGPNGLIHLITTMNNPCLHFEMNEAWIMSGDPWDKGDRELMKSTATSICRVKRYYEGEAGGPVKASWTAGIADDGRWLLDGTETWYYEDGSRQYQASYRLGGKTGWEILWNPEGSVVWTRRHNEDGTTRWTQYHSNGNKKAESIWKKMHCEGPARLWDACGGLVSEVTFRGGKME